MNLWKSKRLLKRAWLANSFATATFVMHALYPVAVSAANPGIIRPTETIPMALSESAHGRLFPKTKKIQPHKVVHAVITAYTSTPDQTDDTPFIGASGKHVYDGMIAANWLPFGTKIKIPELFGDKEFTVDDRMNSRYGYGRMDMWMDAPKSAARAFGVKRTQIEIYYPEKHLAVR